MKRFLLALSLMAGATGAFAAAEPDSSPQQPTVYLVADAHLDTQWNWDIQTTIKDYVWNTLNQNLALLERYPRYVFNFEGGVKYAWMKEYFPREYEMMKRHIADGRWHISGASWDATDAIVPSVESALRNILLGQEYYRREFGVESTDIFLPDCFGFGWTLPTIASHCGLIGFSSQKLGWRVTPFYGSKRYPFNVGIWRGVDGSEIMMAHGYGYGTRWEIEDLAESDRLKQLLANESQNGVLFHYYGTGDIGGSPTITSVDAVDRAASRADGSLRIVSAPSDAMFKAYLPYSDHPELPSYDGELLMDVHGTGCYTSQAAMKLYNRQNELLGDAAERAAVAAEMLGAAAYPGPQLTEAWRRFIFHQFHDDLTGTSIPRAYEFSWNDELLSLKQFATVTASSVGAVASQLDTRVKGTPVVLYNALGHEATDVVELTVDVKGTPTRVTATDHRGVPVAAQILEVNNGRARLLVEATVPANGYAVYGLNFGSSRRTANVQQPASAIENSVYRLTLDDKGDITSLYDKLNQRELVKPGKAIRLAIFTENESFAWPAWEVLKATVDREPQSIDSDVRARIVESGPLRSTLCVEKRHGDSKFRQYIRLYEGALADRIDFFNEVDWATTNALVKAEFPLTVANPQACYDLGIGTAERGNNCPTAYEVPAQRWADLTDARGDYGVTVMNDCKYGWDKPDDSTLRLTLLHTPKTKKSYAYQDHQDFGHHTFTYSLVGHRGALSKSDASRRADMLNQRVKAFAATKHAGSLGSSFSPATISGSNLAIKALKKAESSDEYVVRVYETDGAPAGSSAEITFARPIASAVEADGTERTLGPASFEGSKLTVAADPNAIKTYKVRFAPSKSVATAEYTHLPLDYDKKCMSWNQFAGDADFSSGYGYAAELVPASLTASGVPFQLENQALLNGKACHGDTIVLPEGAFTRLYLLAATADEEAATEGLFTIGSSRTMLRVPSYTGFIGQWGHTDHTQGYLLDDEVAFVGTHRHSAAGDHPYEFTYMFKYALDIPAGSKQVVLPDNPSLVIFAATLAKNPQDAPEALSPLFRTSLDNPTLNSAAAEPKGPKVNLLRSEHLVAWSGHVNDREHPRFLTDGDPTTKWCDVGGIPSFVEYDLGSPQTLTEWSLTNAGSEQTSYVTSTCMLQARNSTTDDWTTIDTLVGNRRNAVSRRLASPVEARYLRLMVVQPEQGTNSRATRIYEFGVY